LERPSPPHCSGGGTYYTGTATAEAEEEGAFASIRRRTADQSYQTVNRLVASEIVHVHQNLPLVLSMLDLTQSGATRLLQSKGVRNIAAEMTARGFPLAGRTQHYLSNWQTITQDEWVLSVVKGYRIKFLQKPYQQRKPLQLTFIEKEEECMQAEIQSMLDKLAISREEDNSESFYSQMFLVPKKDGRQRPVINLKRLNQSVKTEHFKMEGIHMLIDLLRAGDWMAKIDLKDAYFIIPIAQEDRDFLNFSGRTRRTSSTAYRFGCPRLSGSLPRPHDQSWRPCRRWDCV
jgi:hypothetical protein